jgi:hypothetical protein
MPASESRIPTGSGNVGTIFKQSDAFLAMCVCMCVVCVCVCGVCVVCMCVCGVCVCVCVSVVLMRIS